MSKSSKPGSSYIPRKLYDKSDVDIVADGMKNHQNALLLGPRGVGKTSLAEVVAQKLGLELVTVPCHTGATAEELIGQWVPAQDGKGFTWMDGLITNAVRLGKILFLDEVNSLRPEVSFCIHGLLDHRRELVLLGKPGQDGAPEVIQAHKSFGMIAAGNPFYEGVRVLNEAFRDRFAIQIRFGYVTELDNEVLNRHPIMQGLPAEQQVAISTFVQKVRGAVKSKTLFSDISTRAFIDLLQNIGIHSHQVARTMFLSRFDDEAEINAVRTIFREVWDDRGNVQAAVAQSAKAAGKTGRAGRFAAGADQDTDAAAKQTF